MISDQTLDAIKTATDLPSLISEYGVKLHRSHGGFLALCPFHAEKTPSFRIHAAGKYVGRYKCFGCAAAGDALTFLMQIEGIKFQTAAEILSLRTGISLDRQRVRPVQRVFDREDIAMCQWWWENRLTAIRASLDLAFAKHESPEDRACNLIGAFSRWVDGVPVRDRLEMFRRMVRSQERYDWRDAVKWDKEFGDAWMSLAQ